MTAGNDTDDVIQDLRRLLVGTIAEDQFRAKYQVASCPAALAAAWHGVEHWFADADIRSRDPEYRRIQETEMERLITLVSGGAPPSELQRVTFLGKSRD